MLAKVLTLFLLFALCKYSTEFGCSQCTVLTANFCCKFKSLCCTSVNITINATNQATGATTPGFCPNPIPRIPPQGLLARTCTNDNQCPFGFKCCPIMQSGTGTTYQICMAPSFNATLGLRRGFCPTQIQVVPPQGLSVRMCTGDEDCVTELRCCPILQNSTGRFFQVCTVPQITLLTTTRPPAPGK